MKIAILFSGRIYKFGNHYNNIMENIVQDHDADIFLSHSPEINEDLDAFSNLYNPVAVCNDPIPDFDFTKYNLDLSFIRPKNIFQMHYNRKRVFNLLKTHIEKTGTEYDVVISHRFDVFCFDKLDLELYKSGLCIPDDKNGKGVNDQFALGSYESMETYMNVVDNMISYIDSGTEFVAEAILARHLCEYPILRFPFKTAIIRDTEYADHIQKKIVFASGSCRLLRTIYKGSELIRPLHSMFYNFIGINFLGKLHNIKQHIQFILFITGKIILPDYILQSFLTSYSRHPNAEHYSLNPMKVSNILDEFTKCDYYIFEICSLKLYEKDGYQVQFELINDTAYRLQAEDDLFNDLKILRNIIPNKHIIFQSHFRHKTTANRDIIYNTIDRFCKETSNVYLHDPTVLSDPDLLENDTHFNDKGYSTNFEYLCKNYFKD